MRERLTAKTKGHGNDGRAKGKAAEPKAPIKAGEALVALETPMVSRWVAAGLVDAIHYRLEQLSFLNYELQSISGRTEQEVAFMGLLFSGLRWLLNDLGRAHQILVGKDADLDRILGFDVGLDGEVRPKPSWSKRLNIPKEFPFKTRAQREDFVRQAQHFWNETQRKMGLKGL